MSNDSMNGARANLPIESDFVYPETSCLDQRHAWKQFGGLTLEEAKTKFAENPLFYQEDFLYMGTNAFAFYFPVIDWWLRGVPEQDEPEHDSEARILAYAIRQQFDERTTNRLRAIVPDAFALAEFVRDNIRRFGTDEEERQRVREAWTELSLHLLEVAGA